MTHLEISQLENASRVATVWAPEGYDGQTHTWGLVAALAPALFIIGAAAAFLYFVV